MSNSFGHSEHGLQVGVGQVHPGSMLDQAEMVEAERLFMETLGWQRDTRPEPDQARLVALTCGVGPRGCAARCHSMSRSALAEGRWQRQLCAVFNPRPGSARGLLGGWLSMADSVGLPRSSP
jgi:hypothetical protein